MFWVIFFSDVALIIHSCMYYRNDNLHSFNCVGVVNDPLPLLFHECRLCVIAGNISPIDVITHVPILCEESDIPYIYVASKEVIQ